MDNLISRPRYEDAHQGTDEIEETIGKVGEGSHAEDGGLGHTTGVPRNKHGGYCNCIFGGTTQKAALVAIAAVDVLEHVTSENDRDVLVGSGDVEEEA